MLRKDRITPSPAVPRGAAESFRSGRTVAVPRGAAEQPRGESETTESFLTEQDLSKLILSLCNYLSLGQTELGRALLWIVARRDVDKAIR